MKINSSVLFSLCGKYRYRLNRRINLSRKEIIFIGLNPSTANAECNDSTLRRLINFAGSWGYGSLVVINLFARISSRPNILKSCSNPIGKLNNFELKNKIKDWSEDQFCDLWLGWGVHGSFMKRDEKILKEINKYSQKKMANFPKAKMPLALGRTKGGQPRHPLYMPNTSDLSTFLLFE